MSTVKPIITTAALGLLVSIGCTPPPPSLPAPRPAIPVSASFNRTWDAVLAVFGQRNIPVDKDRLSGTIASTGLRDVMSKDAAAKECGFNKAGDTVYAEFVKYRITMKGDSTKSTLHAGAVYLRTMGASFTECPTAGTWEAEFEAAVKQKAEQP